MDGVGAAASLWTLIQLAGKVIQYLKEVKEGSDSRQKLVSELETVQALYSRLYTQTTEERTLSLPDKTSRLLHDGPLEQMRKVLADIANKLGVEIVHPDNSVAAGAETSSTTLDQDQPLSKLKRAGYKLRKVGEALTWPFDQKDIKEWLGILGRQQRYIELALNLDNKCVHGTVCAQ